MNKKYISLRNKEISRDREIEWETRLNDYMDTFIKRGTNITTEINICKVNLVNGNYDMALKYLKTLKHDIDNSWAEITNLYNLLESSKDVIQPVLDNNIEGQMSITDYPGIA